MDGAGRCDQHAAHEKNPDLADREVDNRLFGNQQPADRTNNAEERN
jgi:hypothetical protein